MSEAVVAEQRTRFGAWLQRHIGNEPITFVETHVSILALTDDRVWKLKKAARFAFIDLSTPELRRANCEREVRLNRRFAPDVYLGVVPLTDETGAVVDTVVEMRRMPDASRLALLARTTAATPCVDRIAGELARIHRDAPTGPEIDRAGLPSSVSRLWTNNLDEMRIFAGIELDADLLAQVDEDARRYLARRDPLFRQRIADDRIRDGHGDLLADDVFCLADGPRFLDCLEFADDLRFGDVLADVAFLAMDLERLGRRDLADRLLERYQQASGDRWPESLADFYIAYRALVRSKVACLSVASSPVAAATARRLLALAADHLAHGRVRLVLVGGPPATGKTTLARELERRTGWPTLHSDEVRKQLAGLQPTDSAAAALDHGLYTPDWNVRTYAQLLETARVLLTSGESVILDASWSDETRRAEAAGLAEETASVLVGLELDLPAGIADARATERARSHVDASDASSPAVTAGIRTRFAAWPEAVRLDAAQPVATLARRALDYLGRS